MRSKRILIVDNDPHIVAGLTANLEHFGGEHIFESCGSGAHALAKLNNGNYALLITDIRIPGIDGWEIVKQARIINPQTRIIVMSGYPTEDIESKIVEYDVFGYITKPFQKQFLLDTVRDALQATGRSVKAFRGYSDACLEELSQQLVELRRVIGAQCVVLADSRGQLISREGFSEGLDLSTLLALIAGGFATSAEMARCLGDEDALNLNYHEGTAWDIYAASLSSEIVLVMLFDKQLEQQSRIGMVWLYAKRSIQQLVEIVQSDSEQGCEAEINEEFKDSLAKGVDALFEVSPATGNDLSTRKAASTQAANTTPKTKLPGIKADEEDTIPLGEAIKRGLVPKVLFGSDDDEGTTGDG